MVCWDQISRERVSECRAVRVRVAIPVAQLAWGIVVASVPQSCQQPPLKVCQRDTLRRTAIVLYI